MKTFKIVLIIFMLFFIAGCSYIMEEAFKQDLSEFTINVYGGNDSQIIVSFSKSSHNNTRDSSTDGTYFRGYYVYRNSKGPYDDFSYRGVTGYSNSTDGAIHSGFVEKFTGDSGTPADSNGETKFVDSCTPNKFYYYRVVVVYQSYTSGSWGGTAEAGKSSWDAAWCPMDLLGGF